MSRRAVVELEELRERLREAEETLAAIRNGEVDSLVVSGLHGDQVFSLRGAEQPYRVFVEQMLEGAVTLTGEGTVLYCNRRFAEMVRSRLEKVIGAQIQAFVRPPDEEALAAILRDPAGRKARYFLTAADGTLIPAQLAFSRLRVDDALDAICVVVTDLTEQEEKREQAAALLSLRAAQEQLRRQNEELARARAAAEAANEAKDGFLAALSHELRTPLMPVLMTVAALESDASLPAAVRDDLALLRRNVELEARLIDDLLDLTRIARGKIELRPEVTDLHAVVAAALDICQSDISAKGLRLAQELGATRPHVSGDPIRLQQILWNLIRNAVKFTSAGGHVTIRSADEGDRICVTVTDSGIGIDPEAIGRIFTPFEQTDRRITRQFGGLGLGLSISQRLTEMHGGTVAAASEGRGKGATFTLTLPVVARQAAEAAAATCDGKAGARGLRILLVEDHADTRKSMARLLGRRHAVRDVDCIAAAVEAAQSQPFDLVISDLGLPDGSGLELMRRLRQQYRLKGICLSGYGMEEDLARSAEAGFDHHLTKPIDVERLESIIESLAR